jgi:hypothetical protein
MLRLIEQWQIERSWFRCNDQFAEISRIERGGVNDLQYQPVYGGCVGARRLGTLMSEMEDIPLSSATAIVSGDDSVYHAKIFVSIAGVRTPISVIIEGDATTYDRTEGKAANLLQSQYYAALGMSTGVRQEIEACKKAKTKLVNPEDRSEYVIVDMGKSSRQRSGLEDTSLGNSVNQGHCHGKFTFHLASLLAGIGPQNNFATRVIFDTWIVQVYKDFFKSIGIKMKAKLWERISQASFLKGFKVLAHEVGNEYVIFPVWVPSIAKIVKLATHRFDPLGFNFLSKHKDKKLRYCIWYCNLLASFRPYTNMPMFKSLIKAYKPYEKYEAPKDPNEEFWRPVTETEDRYVVIDWSDVFGFYGLEYDSPEVENLNVELESHEPGIFYTSPVFAILAEIEYK